MAKSLVPFPLRRRWPAVVLSTCVLAGCSNPVSPDLLPPVAGAQTAGAPAGTADAGNAGAKVTSAEFPLFNGTFTLELSGTGGSVGLVSGSYSGNVSATTAGRQSADLTLQITQRTGSGTDVTTIDASGSGSFIDEGKFSLSLSVTSAAKPPDGGVVRTIIRGTAEISCSASEHILITLRGSGSLHRLGDIEVVLQHEVGNTSCSS